MNLVPFVLTILVLLACDETPQWHKQVMIYHQACKANGGLVAILPLDLELPEPSWDDYVNIHCKDGTIRVFWRPPGAG